MVEVHPFRDPGVPSPQAGLALLAVRPAPHTQYSLGGRAGPNLTEVLGRVERSEVVERDEDRGQRTEDTVEGEFVDEWRKRPWRRFCGNSLVRPQHKQEPRPNRRTGLEA